jgi:copper chaperone NosL
MKRLGLVFVLAEVGACTTPGSSPPAKLDTVHETCRSCRMAVSDPRFAAQIVAPSEEPIFFDDVGCLRDYLASRPPLRRGSIAYVADHRTTEWVAAGRAVYTRNSSIATPMGSRLMAHASGESRDDDPDARSGTPLTSEDIFAPSPLPDGRR